MVSHERPINSFLRFCIKCTEDSLKSKNFNPALINCLKVLSKDAAEWTTFENRRLSKTVERRQSDQGSRIIISFLTDEWEMQLESMTFRMKIGSKGGNWLAPSGWNKLRFKNMPASPVSKILFTLKTSKRGKFVSTCQPIYSVTLKFSCENEVSIRATFENQTSVPSSCEFKIEMILKNKELKPLDGSFSLSRHLNLHRNDTDCEVITADLPSLGLSDEEDRDPEFSLTVLASQAQDAVIIELRHPTPKSNSDPVPDRNVKKPSSSDKGRSLELEFSVYCDSREELQLFDGKTPLELKDSDNHRTGATTLRVREEQKFADLHFLLQIGSNTKPICLKMLDDEKFAEDFPDFPEKIIIRVNVEPFKTIVLVPKYVIIRFDLRAKIDRAVDPRVSTVLVATNFGEFKLDCSKSNAGIVTLSHGCQIIALAERKGLLNSKQEAMQILECRLGEVKYDGATIPNVPASSDGILIKGSVEDLAKTIAVESMQHCNLIDLIVRSGDCVMKFDEALHVTGNFEELGRSCTEANKLRWSSEHGKGVKCFRSSLLASCKLVKKDDGSTICHSLSNLPCGDGSTTAGDLYIALIKQEKSDSRDNQPKEQCRWALSDCIAEKRGSAEKAPTLRNEGDQHEEGSTLIARLTIKIKDCPAQSDSISIKGNCTELQASAMCLRRLGSSNVFSGVIDIQMNKNTVTNTLTPQGLPNGTLLKFSLFAADSGSEESFLRTSKEKEWTLPPIDSFRKDTGKGKMLMFLVSMKWDDEPIVLQIVDVTVRIAVLCEIKLGEFIRQVRIQSNIDSKSQPKDIFLNRSAQVKKPAKADPTGLEKWSSECKVTACSNGEKFFNLDEEQLSFSAILLVYKSGRKVTVVVHCSTIKLQSDPTRREIHYEVTVGNDYNTIDFRPGVQVTLQLAYGPCTIRTSQTESQKVNGKFTLRSSALTSETTANCITAGAIVDEIPYSCVCTCRDSSDAKAGKCEGNEIVRASKPATLLMYKHGQQLLLSGKGQLFVEFEQPDAQVLMLRQTSLQAEPKQQSANPERGESIRVELNCGPAFGNLEYYCQVVRNARGLPSMAVITSPITVQLKFVTKHNTMDENKKVCIIGRDPKLKKIKCMGKKDHKSDVSPASRGKKHHPDTWIQKVTLKMYQIEEELFLAGRRRLCVKRGLASNGINEAIDKEQYQEIQLLTHQPGECLQFQIELFPGNIHRVFPNMPMNQLPKDSILRYFQTALYSALPKLSIRPQFVEVRDVYAKRLVPLIKQNGDYDEADGASRPHEFHDIWGEDLESDLDAEDQVAITEPKSAVKYVEQKRRRNLESSRDFTREIHRRLNRKYHSRERAVWIHLSAAAVNCDACRGIYAEYKYQGSLLCKDCKRLLHDEYIRVLKDVAKSISSSECTCQHDHQLIMTHSAAVVRGRLEAFLVDNTSNMLSDLFYDEWRQHTEAAGSWFVLLLAIWDRFKQRTRLGFEDVIREDYRPVPAFFKWRLIDK